MKHAKVSKGYRGLGMEGSVARWYARLVQKDLTEYRRAAGLVAEQAPAGGRVLDLATGPGNLAIELARLGKHHVVGLDVSKTFVQIATQNAAREGLAVEFLLGDACRMPFDAGWFDFVVCRAAFKNFADPVAALEEIHRVLKPGGKAVILDLRKDAPLQAIKAHVARMHLSPLNAFITRLTFRHMLLKRAYTTANLERFVSATRFSGCELRDNAIEIQVWLAKEGPPRIAAARTA
jgi:ubiquinone/menaquinone biosynthesis C-methylase UbiE